jgi:allantoin racemase
MRIDVIHANSPASGKLDEARASSIRAAGAPGTEITIRLPHHAPTSITSQYDDARAAPSVLEQVLAAAREGADALVINCTADTAVEAAREAVAIPVVGVSEAAMHLAAQLADRFSVLTFADRIAARFFAMARRLGMAHKLVSVRSVEMPLEEITDRGRLAADLAQVATACVREDGAHLIILGCTDFELATLETAAHLRRAGIEVPLLRPFAIGVRQAEMLVDLALSHSKLTYPLPRDLT